MRGSGTRRRRLQAFCRHGEPFGLASARTFPPGPAPSGMPLGQLVKGCRGAYLLEGRLGPLGVWSRGGPMPELVAAPSTLSRPLLIAAAVAGLLVAGTLALWLHYGTAVFYEMILAGIALCF